MLRRRWLFVLPLLGVVACSSEPTVSWNDGGTTPDAGADAGTLTDGGGTDAGELDAGWPYDCPLETCQVEDKSCLSFADNAGADVALLRMAQLTISKPSVLTDTLLGEFVNQSVLPDAADCSLNGTGSASWLIEFDTSGDSPVIRTGTGRLIRNDGTYFFRDETIVFGGSNVAIEPKTLATTLAANGVFGTTETANLNFVVEAQNGSTLAMLPLEGVSLAGTLSSNRNCIGRYRAETLDSDLACEADNGELYFAEGGTVRAYISLEVADDLYISVAGASLCVVLSGDDVAYGNGQSPTRCKRDLDGNIVYQGDWCSTTNAPASSGCADAVRLEGTFAANAVPAQQSE